MTKFTVRFSGQTIPVTGLNKAKKLADQMAIEVGAAEVRCVLPGGLTTIYRAGR